MSVHVLSWAWKVDVGDAGAKLVLLKLADQANDAGECWPSKKTMARDCELSTSTVRRKLDYLATRGLIEIETRDVGGRQTSNLYRIKPRGVIVTPPPGQADTPGGVIAVTPLEPSEEPGSSLRTSAHASIYEALVAAVYSPGAKLTKAEARRVAVAANNIVSAGGTPELVELAKRRYLSHTTYGKCALTAQALSQHWAELVPATSTGACGECGLGGGRHAADCSRAAAA